MRVSETLVNREPAAHGRQPGHNAPTLGAGAPAITTRGAASAAAMVLAQPGHGWQWKRGRQTWAARKAAIKPGLAQR